MAGHIPFASGAGACGLISKYYSDSAAVRVPADRAAKLKALLPDGPKLWVDCVADGLDDLGPRRPQPGKPASTWFTLMKSVPGYDSIASGEFQARPVQAVVDEFVAALLDRCAVEKPDWITVPQLPVVNGSERNKINRALAKAAGTWRAAAGGKSALVLPVILTHAAQTAKQRGPRVQLTAKCYADARAGALWVVDSSLSDESGSETLRDKMRGLISFHEELNAAIEPRLRIGGPYWCLNLVLWARGLIDHPAIGVGSGYQYMLSGSRQTSPTARFPLSPIRRRAKVGPELRRWLEEAAARIPVANPVRARFERLREQYTEDEEKARARVAQFYKSWFDDIAANPTTGRAMALFQDLSQAYALGKSLLADLPLPKDESGRRAEAVAEHLMFCCL